MSDSHPVAAFMLSGRLKFAQTYGERSGLYMPLYLFKEMYRQYCDDTEAERLSDAQVVSFLEYQKHLLSVEKAKRRVYPRVQDGVERKAQVHGTFIFGCDVSSRHGGGLQEAYTLRIFHVQSFDVPPVVLYDAYFADESKARNEGRDKMLYLVGIDATLMDNVGLSIVKQRVFLVDGIHSSFRTPRVEN